MRKLLWKEWHEQSWKLAFGCVLLSALAVIGLHARIIDDQTMMMWICVLGFTMLPILSSTGLIPAERAEGSFESLLAMPIAPWKILLAKAAVGLLLCVGPMLCACVVSCVMAGGREIYTVAILDLYGRTTFASIVLFFWMSTLTSQLPSEARAGLVAVGILICWFLISMGLWREELPSRLILISPLAFIRTWALESDLTKVVGIFLILQSAIGSVLIYFTLKAFPRTSRRES